MELCDLPDDVQQLLAKINASPRLIVHLTLVHDAALEILNSLQLLWPALQVDRLAVLFGAATHDIGKCLHPQELFGPGNRHELEGPALLQEHGVTSERSRFAQTHGAWKHDPALALEDHLVSLADNCWKGVRNEELESKVAERISRMLDIERWEVFIGLDEIAGRVASRAEQRLAWQGRVGQ